MELSTWPPNYASFDNITRAACASSDCMVSLAFFVMQTHNHPLSKKKMVHLTHQHGCEVLLVKDNRHERHFLLDSRGHFHVEVEYTWGPLSHALETQMGQLPMQAFDVTCSKTIGSSGTTS